MVFNNEAVLPSATISSESDYNRTEELKAFDDTKTGVKGLVDSGLQKVPKIFIRPPNKVVQNSDSNLTHFAIPVIDLGGIHEDKRVREEIVHGIKSASENWGFFRVVNHGVPLSVLDEMIKGVIRFNEQDDEVKKEYYSRDETRNVRFNSNFDLYTSKAANWRDSLAIYMLRTLRSNPLHPSEMPTACRDISMEYAKHVSTLGDTLFELLSEALGLKTDYLNEMGCAEHCLLVSRYYPACPEPELTLGTAKHTDPAFVTILLQDDIDGLQVLHQDLWVDVRPIPGSLIVNIGDLLQITSNDKLKSVEHRVLANQVGPRVSVASFLTPAFNVASRYKPIKELISDDTGPVYKEISLKEYVNNFNSEGLDGKSGLDNFKL
ncbi:hypothetical protein AQUCO_03400387v1 [Aquilegia coerulea]|uniref:Fe2OG dioxygenase domain-containing protein n=1 Tax=Aquilegia coerulea TaxID=218851 RepID=A0A2G5CYX5_AQUCA|nr:hypothetical protein AQUCO_03400387v1 [Aquilegia coerulea]